MDDGACLLLKNSMAWVVHDVVVPVFHRLKLDDKRMSSAILYPGIS